MFACGFTVAQKEISISRIKKMVEKNNIEVCKTGFSKYFRQMMDNKGDPKKCENKLDWQLHDKENASYMD